MTSVRSPRWFWIPAKILVVTFPITILSFAVGLLLGIIGTAITAKLRGVPLNITLAYRHIAPWVAVTVGAIAVISMTIIEVRHYRQAKALARIEQASRV